jgi:hypothetical protein
VWSVLYLPMAVAAGLVWERGGTVPVGWLLALFGGQRGFTSGKVVVRAIGNDLHTDYRVIDQTRRLAVRTDPQG